MIIKAREAISWVTLIFMLGAIGGYLLSYLCNEEVFTRFKQEKRALCQAMTELEVRVGLIEGKGKPKR